MARTEPELTDAQWAALEPLLPPQQPATGRPNNDHPHYRHTTPEMATRVVDAIQQRLTVLLQVAERAVENHPSRSTLRAA